MADQPTASPPVTDPASTAADPTLCDEDILDAMAHIEGYVDISTEDFRALYKLARQHAVERMWGGVRAGAMMRPAVVPLRSDILLDEAARSMARQGYKGLPVVDEDGRVAGMLTETDFLRRLGAESFPALLLRLLEEPGPLRHRCHETPVSEAMTAPAVTVQGNAGFEEIIAAFHRHPGRSMPVVDPSNRLLGLLLRKDFLAACRLSAA